jgi:hypothetical protein
MAQGVQRDDPMNIALAPASGIPWFTRIFLVFFYAIAIVSGVRNIWFWKHSALDLLIPVASALCLAIWALEDARRRKYRIPSLSKPWFFLLAGIVVPGYVIWSRGWRGLGWVVLHFVCWVLLEVITQQVGGTIVFGAEWCRAMGLK